MKNPLSKKEKIDKEVGLGDPEYKKMAKSYIAREGQAFINISSYDFQNSFLEIMNKVLFDLTEKKYAIEIHLKKENLNYYNRKMLYIEVIVNNTLYKTQVLLSECNDDFDDGDDSLQAYHDLKKREG